MELLCPNMWSAVLTISIGTPLLLTILVIKFERPFYYLWIRLNTFPASGDFCRLLITFANGLDPDHTLQNVWPDLDPNCLTLMVSLKGLF